MHFSFSVNFLVSFWVGYRKLMTPLSSSVFEYISSRGTRASFKKTVNSEPLPFFEFSKHNLKFVIYFIDSGLYCKKVLCQKNYCFILIRVPASFPATIFFSAEISSILVTYIGRLLSRAITTDVVSRILRFSEIQVS